MVDPKPFARGDHVELAERLVGVLADAHPKLVGDEARIHGYEAPRGVFVPVEPTTLSRIVQGFAGAEILGAKRRLSIKAPDVSGAIRLAYDRLAEPKFFANAKAGLAFANGFTHVTENGVALVPHSPNNRARFAYAFDYPGNRPAKMFLQFLHDAFRDDTDREEKICCLQEHLGASLVGQATHYQRAIVNIGGGGEGKSAFAGIASKAFPPGSVEAIAPQDWHQEYRRAMLAGKLLNIVAELPEADIIASDAFKAIITGDSIVGRHIREAPFTFKPIAGHMFAANRLPGTNDQTEGFWRRLIVLRFNRRFDNDPACDPHIGTKIVEAELPMVVAWMLEGAVRLMRQHEYTIPSSHADELRAWRGTADQVSAFLDERAEPSQDGWGTAASVAYQAYRAWADSNGHRALSSTKFGMRMRELKREAIHARDGNVYPVSVKGCERVSVVPSRDSRRVSGASN